MDEQAGAGAAAGQGSLAARVAANLKSGWIEGVFYFVLVITVGQAIFIVWDLLTQIPGFMRLAGLTQANTRVASADLSNFYLALLGVYAGGRELQRWTGSDATPEEVAEHVEWFSRGSMIVYFWLGLTAAAIFLKDLHVIARLPNELFRTAVQSLAIWAGTRGSREIYRKRVKSKAKQAGESAPDARLKTDEPNEQSHRISEEDRRIVLDYLAKNEYINSTILQEISVLNRFQCNRLIGNLEAEEILEGEGVGRGRKYRLRKPPEQGETGQNADIA